MQRLARWLQRRLLRHVVLYALLQAAILVAVRWMQHAAPEQHPPLDLRWQYTPEEALRLMQSYSDRGRTAVAVTEVCGWACC